MPTFFRVIVDEQALTEALYDFVTDPSEKRNDRPVVQEVQELIPDMISVLEHMILDGVDEKDFVAQYVHYLFGHLAA